MPGWPWPTYSRLAGLPDADARNRRLFRRRDPEPPHRFPAQLQHSRTGHRWVLAAGAIGIFHGLTGLLTWSARTPAMTLISEYSLSVFLAISLMSMQLWTLSGMAGPLLVVVVIAYVWIVLFPLLGRDYQSAVLSAGFVGLSLGATPTAVANMTAVTRHYGPSPTFFGH
ncbi:hypothetical protein IHE39_28605 [Aminobacter carboxidus]|uniref:Uncharacterized protein n=1 Tax=Aminobacter carboxidus TaxID=376165 RepID=A0ABR9GX51_9HYPH|nr:hypothetical protein [Aminobacter carboxidus]